MKLDLTAIRIDRATADKEIKEFTSLSKVESDLIKKSSVKVQPEVQSTFQNFSKKKYNAFVFPMSDIKRFFDSITGDADSGKCEYLMVILGAHFDNAHKFKKGTRTVIVAGVNPSTQQQGTGPAFTTLDIPNPGTEYPPQIVIANIPGPKLHGDSNVLEFIIS